MLWSRVARSWDGWAEASPDGSGPNIRLCNVKWLRLRSSSKSELCEADSWPFSDDASCELRAHLCHHSLLSVSTERGLSTRSSRRRCVREDADACLLLAHQVGKRPCRLQFNFHAYMRAYVHWSRLYPHIDAPTAACTLLGGPLPPKADPLTHQAPQCRIDHSAATMHSQTSADRLPPLATASLFQARHD